MDGSERYLEGTDNVLDTMGGRAKGKRVSRPIPRSQDYAAEQTTVPLADMSNTGMRR